jgi:hypothetical protein
MARERSYDRLKNFSTTIEADKTVMEIERMLAKFGAKKILKEFDGNQRLIGLAFTVDTPQGEMPIKLPAKIDKIEQVFKIQVSRGLLSRKYWGSDWAKEQSVRTAWRTIKDWIDAQFALISIEMVKVEEIFLPYAYSARLGQTLYEAIENKKIDLSRMLGEAKKKESDDPDLIDITPEDMT